MNWLEMSLAKAMMREAAGDDGGSPAATLVSDGAAAGSDGGAADPGAGDKGGDGGDAGKKAPDYLSSIPKEFRDNKAFLEHEDLSSFLKKSLADSDKLASFDPEKVLNIPGEDASEEDREAFYQKLGKPKTAEGYELDDPGFPDGLPEDEALVGHLRQWAYEANMPADALKYLVGKYNAHIAGVFTAMQVENEKLLLEQTIALKTELKDGYNEHVLKAQRAVKQLGGEEFINLLQDSGLESHPIFLKVFGKLGDMISEDSALGGSGGGGGGEGKPKGWDGQDRLTYKSDNIKKE